MLSRNYICLYLVLVFATLSYYTKAADTNVSSSTLTLGVSEVSLLKTSSGVINLTLGHQEAGMPVETSKSDSTARLLISSVITSATRTLSAKVSAGSVPTGAHLALMAMQPNASFVGASGTLGPQVTLDATDRPVVTGIGTCYSGTAADDGYPLKFTFGLDLDSGSYGALRATTGVQIVVTLTLTAAQ